MKIYYLILYINYLFIFIIQIFEFYDQVELCSFFCKFFISNINLNEFDAKLNYIQTPLIELQILDLDRLKVTLQCLINCTISFCLEIDSLLFIVLFALKLYIYPKILLENNSNDIVKYPMYIRN